MKTLEKPSIKQAVLSLFLPMFHFFASLQLAIFILVTLMAVLAAGTIVESLHGTDAARIVIYQSWWFSLLLLLLGINLAVAALDRLPWQVRHVGFVTTHAGIILLLIGSFMTQRGMIDGQMAIAENETEHRITLSEPILYLYSEKEQKSWFVDLKKRAFPWQGNQEITKANDGEPLPFPLALTAYYPKARMKEKIIGTGTGSARFAELSVTLNPTLPVPVPQPAVNIRLHNDFVDQTQWLLRGNPDLSEAQMGPAKLRFAEELLKESGEPAPATGYLEFQFEKNNINLPLTSDLKLPAVFLLEGTPYQVKILRLFRNAMVNGKELVEQDDKSAGAGQNPAAQLLLIGQGLEERHTAFAKFPDFPTAHGLKPSAAGARIFYRLPGSGPRGEEHEIRFVEKEGKLFCQIHQGLKVATHEVEKGKEIPTGWMGNLTVTVEEFYPAAILKREFTPEPNTSESEGVLPAIQLVIARPKAEAISVWLRQGIREEADIAGSKYFLMYGEKRIPAGFKLTLRDFRMERYSGTDRPASFESDVTLKDDSRGVVKDVTISMNQPLSYRGYHIYQSGYSQPQGEPEISIFSVGKDPGVPVKYAGAIVMVAGILTMFYTRRFSNSEKRTL